MMNFGVQCDGRLPRSACFSFERILSVTPPIWLGSEMLNGTIRRRCVGYSDIPRSC